MSRGRQNNLTGIASELLVCADLLCKGWYPFRSLYQFSPYDLVVYDGAQLWRVEVKTGGKDGRPHFGTGAHRSQDGSAVNGTQRPIAVQSSWPDDPQFDVCAVVQRDGSIEYYNREHVRIWTHNFPVTEAEVEAE